MVELEFLKELKVINIVDGCDDEIGNDDDYGDHIYLSLKMNAKARKSWRRALNDTYSFIDEPSDALIPSMQMWFGQEQAQNLLAVISRKLQEEREARESALRFGLEAWEAERDFRDAGHDATDIDCAAWEQRRSERALMLLPKIEEYYVLEADFEKADRELHMEEVRIAEILAECAAKFFDEMSVIEEQKIVEDVWRAEALAEYGAKFVDEMSVIEERKLDEEEAESVDESWALWKTMTVDRTFIPF